MRKFAIPDDLYDRIAAVGATNERSPLQEAVYALKQAYPVKPKPAPIEPLRKLNWKEQAIADAKARGENLDGTPIFGQSVK